MHPIVIIGTGLAGYTLARELRKLDSITPLVMITADDGGFYSKPMLSNALLRGKTPAQLISADAAKMAADINAVIRVRTQVEAIDTVAHTVTANGETIHYSRLVLAVGARPIRLPLEGDGADDVLTVNSLDDYARFHAQVQGARRVAVIGPGLIGCEFANDLAGAGHAVTVIGPDPHPLGRLLPAEAGNAVRDALSAVGIQWRLGTVVSRVERDGGAYRLLLADGSEVHADVVLSAIGLQADTRLAQQAGLTVNRGIVVNGQLRTSAEDTYALGDCAEVNGVVLPFVLPLMEQARTLAAVLAGREAAVNYPPMPVAVKTPACPVVVAPPAPGSGGQWQVQADGEGVRAEFVDGTLLRGFALTGAAISAKQALVKQLAAL
ncbi:MAG: FAD-dependent oxidoreductase [Gammaproteobacteria bacterium HGW-Gammaproteobacteria-1]|jgi:rubredoxin-NAD+ reductase|nr:MAG: FAD-dependent oxidoreductase [Gammaproteobacteria bacterium HGW-Gammaproteobacteria-1]